MLSSCTFQTRMNFLLQNTQNQIVLVIIDLHCVDDQKIIKSLIISTFMLHKIKSYRFVTT